MCLLCPCFTPLNKTLPLLLSSPLVHAFAYQSVAQLCFAFAQPLYTSPFPCVALLRLSTASRIFSLLVLRSTECFQTLPCFRIALPIIAIPLHCLSRFSLPLPFYAHDSVPLQRIASRRLRKTPPYCSTP